MLVCVRECVHGIAIPSHLFLFFAWGHENLMEISMNRIEFIYSMHRKYAIRSTDCGTIQYLAQKFNTEHVPSQLCAPFLV